MQKKGIAIGYSPFHNAPEIIALAKGYLVEKLLQIAKENNITIYQDSDLAEVLSFMEPGDEIPENLYLILAEVLTYCYNVNEKFREKMIKNM